MSYFGKTSLQDWQSELMSHNRTLARGHRLHLCPTLKPSFMQITSIDEFIIRVHPEKITQVLHALCNFVDRAIDASDSMEGDVYPLTFHHIIYRRHLSRLCERVMKVIETTISVAERVQCSAPPSCPDAPPFFLSSPAHVALLAAIRRAFARFTRAMSLNATWDDEPSAPRHLAPPAAAPPPPPPPPRCLASQQVEAAVAPATAGA